LQFYVGKVSYLCTFSVIQGGVSYAGRDYEFKILCYGNREITFGALHMPDGVSKWFTPNAWRTEDDGWIEDYNVKAMGVLNRPVTKVAGEEKWKVTRSPERLWT
jgi:hypothetical protein